MAEFDPTPKIEDSVAKRIRGWEIIRQRQFLEGYDLQFESSDWPNGQGRLIKNAQIIHVTGSVASDVVVTISPKSLELNEGLFVGVNFTEHLSRLDVNQRGIVYGLVASCCDPQKLPLCPPVVGLIEYLSEFDDFITDLYFTRNGIYNRALNIRDNFASRIRDIGTPFD